MGPLRPGENEGKHESRLFAVAGRKCFLCIPTIFGLEKYAGLRVGTHQRLVERCPPELQIVRDYFVCPCNECRRRVVAMKTAVTSRLPRKKQEAPADGAQTSPSPVESKEDAAAATK